MGTSPYSSAGYISRSSAPYNGLDCDFRVRSGMIRHAGTGSLAGGGGGFCDIMGGALT